MEFGGLCHLTYHLRTFLICSFDRHFRFLPVVPDDERLQSAGIAIPLDRVDVLNFLLPRLRCWNPLRLILLLNVSVLHGGLPRLLPTIALGCSDVAGGLALANCLFLWLYRNTANLLVILA